MKRADGSGEGWRKRLRDIFEAVERESADTGTEGRRVKRFIADVVVPAFEDVARELQEHGRDVEVRFGDRKASIQVLHEGGEEFFYEVEARPYGKPELSFPVMPLRDGEGRIYRAEARLRGRALHEDVTDYTREEILESLLREYSRTLRWEL